MQPVLVTITSVTLLLTCGFPLSLFADETPPAESSANVANVPVDYVKDVRPILRAKCAMCHNEAEPSGGLRLDGVAHVMKGGDSGPVLIPGSSIESRLIQAVVQAGDLKMPPPEEGKPLEPAQIEILRRWIDQGAKIPDDENQITHWAFLKPVRPAVPHIEGSSSPLAGNLLLGANEGGAGAVHPIDAFVAQQHAARGLAPIAPAPKHVLLRRVYLDLIGLPPTPEQLAAFENDSSPHAYEKVVDQLLASPHYGERWGRHWMDVWRYSDWDGYGAEVRESKPHIWRWRDWIIESLNADKSYDQMVVEMLAADEACPDDLQAARATGYLVRNWYVFNRNAWLDNTIEHTGKAFMGVTFNCARCHDHMFDPLAQTEYYSLRAVFEPHDVRTDRVPGQSDLVKDGLVRAYDANAAAQTLLFVRGDEKNPLKDKPLAPLVPAVFGNRELPIEPVNLPASSYYPGLQPFVIEEARQNAEVELKSANDSLIAAKQAIEKAQLAFIEFKNRPADPSESTTLLADDFSKARPEIWEPGTGNWQYQDGCLKQLDAADAMCSMKGRQVLSNDFTASLKFRITGGDVYKSAGVAFDVVDDQNLTFIYASSGGSKLQIAHRVNGADQYPANGSKPLAIELNRDHQMIVKVRGSQVEILLNGELQLTYPMPNPRPAQGRVNVWTYDATAEFTAIDVKDAAEVSEVTLMAKRQSAESQVQVAEKKQAIAQGLLDFTSARIAADAANYATPPAGNAKELSLVAGKAEKTWLLLQEDLKLLTAEQSLAAAKAALPGDGMPADEKKTKAVTDAESAVAAAKTAVENAAKAAAEPFEAYTRFTPIYPSSSSGRRLAFARWVVGPENPLAARVAVNHMWLRHFHQPLVPTVFDFGMNGKPASHPELLDWLAIELMESGWKMKSLHRLIVTSQTYRLASSAAASSSDVATAAANSKIDPENRALWRQNSHRMEAEIIRDATFYVAGQLDTTMYGADLDPATGLTLARRSVYFRTSKEKKMTFLSTFDSANPVECYQRAESISPQQSLAMSNSPLTLAQSRILAGKLSEQVPADNSEETAVSFIGLAFRHVLLRDPTAEERTECLAFVKQQSERLAAGSALTSFSGGTANPVKPSADTLRRARENLVHVLMNHNDFVTIR